jgi:hypothetical protein
VYLLPPEEVIGPGADPIVSACHRQIRDGFAIQTATAHTLAADPDAADLVLAPIQVGGYGPCLERLRRSPAYRRHADKLVVYSSDDNQFPAVRGLYPAVTRRWVAAGWALPAHYVSAHIHRFHFRPDELRDKDILFSFVGSSKTHPVRERITALRHPGAVLVDSSPKTELGYWWEKPNKEDYFATFRDVTRRSLFAVCPRGISPSSIRLYEAMEAGCVPVVVSDSMELPVGPAWDTFLVRVAERDVESIPAVVEGLRERAAAMGAAARAAWEAFFSDQATVGSLVGWARQLLKAGSRRPVAVWAAEYFTPRRVVAKLRYSLR